MCLHTLYVMYVLVNRQHIPKLPLAETISRPLTLDVGHGEGGVCSQHTDTAQLSLTHSITSC